jgi:hypothetical protein
MTPKIFLIGFNKCGTSTISSFLTRNGIKSVHHHFGPSPQNPSRNLALILLHNFNLGRNPLEGIDAWTAYSDLSYASASFCLDACRYFRQIHRYYPDAYYILNTRPVEKWIRSRLNHAGGTLARRWMKAYRCDVKQLEDLWRLEFENHTADVTEFFGAQNGNFMVFDIESNTPEQLADFLAPQFSLDAARWRIINATKTTE